MRVLPQVTLILGLILLTGCVSNPPMAPVYDGWSTSIGKKSLYTVQKGDTLYSIAWAFDKDYRDLAYANGLKSPYRLRPGQTLTMNPKPRPVVNKAATIAKPYIPPKPSPKKTTVAATKKPIKSPTKTTTAVKSKPTPKATIAAAPNSVVKWTKPANGKVIGRYSANHVGNRGINIANKIGTPIYAAADGTVVYRGSNLRGYGNLIIIKHNEQYLSAYAHNKLYLVKEGDKVKSGQKIAEMGQNDNGTSLLHFEIRHNGKPVDPAKYVEVS